MNYQILQNKSQFIEQFYSGIIDENLDIEEPSNNEIAERIKAEASGNPLLIDKIKVEKKLKKLRRLKRSYDLSKLETAEKMRELKQFLNTVDIDIASVEKDVETIKNNPIKINKKELDKVTDIGDAVYDEVVKLKKKNLEGSIGSVGDMDIYAFYNKKNDKVTIEFKGETTKELEYDFENQSLKGLGTKIKNRLNDFEKNLIYLKSEKPKAKEDIQRLSSQKDDGFPKEKELNQFEKELADINGQINASADKEQNKNQSSNEDDGNSYMQIPSSPEEKFKLFWGKDYTKEAGKSQDAVDFLLKKQEGHVQGAFYHPELGLIDLVWGDEKSGLKHIKERRIEQWGEEIFNKWVKHLAEIVETGIIDKTIKNETRVVLISPKSSAVIELTYNSIDRHWLMSAFIDRRNKKKLKNQILDDDSSLVDSSVIERTDKQGTNILPPKASSIDIISQVLNKNQDGTKIDSKPYNDKDTKKNYFEGGDTVGVNYIQTYLQNGLPTRPKNGTITVGKKTIKLPSIEEPINADSLRVYLSDIIGNRLYEAKIKNKSALGVYKRDDTAIRVKNYSDIEIMAHELAHFLDFFYKNKTKKAPDSFFRKEIIKNKNEVKSVSYTTNPKLELSEGFAEFVRTWLTNYNTISQVAPNMTKDFEAKLKTDKVLYKKMLTLQEGMHKFYFQGAGTRKYIGGKLDSTAKKIKRSQKEIAKDIRQKAIDKIHTIKRIEADIKGDIENDTIDSPYKLLQMVNGTSSIMYSAMNFGVPTVKENGDITYSGKALNDIFAPATKKGEKRVRLLEQYLVAKRARELKEQGRENLIKDEDIEADLKLVETYPEFETIFKEYQEFNNRMLDFYVDMNLITSSQKKNFEEFNKNYVPFHRITESVQYGEVPPSKIGQRLTGGTHSLGNIMENIIEGLENNIKEALISRGKSVFYKMLEDSGMGGVYATKVATENKKVKVDLEAQAKNIAKVMAELGISVSKDGQIISGEFAEQIIDVSDIQMNLLSNPDVMEFWTHGHKPTSKTGYIDSVIIDDKVVYFETNDIGIIDAMISFRSSHYNEVIQGLMWIKNIMSWNITNNPLFYLANFSRDTVSAAVLSKNNFKPVISSLNGMYHFITKSNTYKEFMSSGAGYGTRRTNLGSDIESMQMLKVNRGLDLINRIISGFGYGADIFEYGTRIGDFALAKKKGKSNLQAGYESREISTDFSIKGSSKGLTGFLATVPFMKAGINGIDKTTRRIFTLNGEMKLLNSVKFRNAHGGIWVQGCKSQNIEKTAKKLREELEATSVYDEIKNRVKEYNIVKDDKLEIQTIAINNAELQADAEAEITLLATVSSDWFDTKLFRNALYSSSLIERKMRKNPDSVKQSDLKQSSETIKMAKESRFGKTPDTVIFNANGEYSKEELAELSVDEIEKLYIAEQKKLIECTIEKENNTTPM